MKYILTTNRLTVIDNNEKTHSVENSHRNFDKICKAVSDNDQEAFETLLADIQPELLPEPDLEGFNHPLFERKNGEFFYRGIWKLGRPETQKLGSMLKYGMDLQPLINFLDNLYNNVSSQVVEQLVKFLDYDELPITEDGCFIAYKGIKSDKFSYHGNVDIKPIQGLSNERGEIFNEEGHVIEVLRNQVNCNPDETCSTGLHVGSYNYARGMGSGILATIKVNPRDVVSVPSDYSGQKLRCCKYTVIKHEVQKIQTPVSDGVKGAEIERSDREKLDTYLEKMSVGVHSYAYPSMYLSIQFQLQNSCF